MPITAYLTQAGHYVIGADSSRAMLDLARSHMPQANFILQDMLALDFGSSFEAIIAWDSIFHVDRQKQPGLFDNCYRWLNPIGFLLVSLGGSDWEGTAVRPDLFL